MQASTTLLKNQAQSPSLFPFHASSVLYNHAHASQSGTHPGGRQTKTNRRRKKQNRICNQNSNLKTVVYRISLAMYITATRKKRRSVLSISSPLISVSQFRAVALLNQWREVHVCHVHVHHQLGNVVNGERYAAIRNAVLMRIDVSSGN